MFGEIRLAYARSQASGFLDPGRHVEANPSSWSVLTCCRSASLLLHPVSSGRAQRRAAHGNRGTPATLRGDQRQPPSRALAVRPAGHRAAVAGGRCVNLRARGRRRSPILLLHGPGDFAGMWMRVIPDLVTTHRIVAPDLPGHGTSQLVDGRLDADGLRAWLSGVIERSCPSPPVLVGHVLGGAIGARFAVNHSIRLSRLVLVDSLGLARFRPTLTFALTMLAFLARPTERTYTRFMRQCSFDLDGLRHELGQRWEPFLAYSLERAVGPTRRLPVACCVNSGSRGSRRTISHASRFPPR
jgi:pimeloyl-ACP methyl ester carboxylesterase